MSKGPIEIGNDVWIGDGAIILSGVKVGDGAIIGAGSVVTQNVEPFSIVAGVPARHIKYRFPENVREILLKLRWWELEPDDLKKIKSLFEDIISEKNLQDIIKNQSSLINLSTD